MKTATESLSSASEQLLSLVERLTAQQGFAEVAASLQAGRGATLGGVWGSSCALVAAGLLPLAPGPLVVVSPHGDDIDDFISDLALFARQPAERFPAWENSPSERNAYDEIYGERLRLLKQLENAEPPRLIVTSIQSLLQPVPRRETLARQTRRLRRGEALPVTELAQWLVERGFHHTSAVELPGEVSVRGGIVDVFAPDWFDPVRIEFFGDEIESLRRFDVSTQRSLATFDEIEITVLAPSDDDREHFTGYLPASTWFVLIEPGDLEEEGRHYLERLDKPQDFHGVSATLRQVYQFPSLVVSGIPAGFAGYQLAFKDRIGRAIFRRTGKSARGVRFVARRADQRRPRAGSLHRLPDRSRSPAHCARFSLRRGWPPPGECTFRSAGSRPASGWCPRESRCSAATSCSIARI